MGEHRTGRINWFRVVLLIMGPLVAVVGGIGFWLTGGRYVATENAYLKADIAQVSAEIDAKVVAVRVREHAKVNVGDVLIELDRQPFVTALAKADAEVDSARQLVMALRAAWIEAQSELKEAEGRVAYWNTQFDRQQQLASRGIIASSKLEEVENSAQQARDRVVVAKSKVERMHAALGVYASGEIDVHPLVREKIAARDAASLDVARTIIRAAVAGHTVNVKLQPGDHVKAATPLLAIVAATRPWVEANFKETELTYVRPGQTATVVLDIYPDVTWQAEITSISPATGAEFALLPPQNASGNWIKVVQRLPVRLRLVERLNEPPLRAGMTATVSVDTHRKRSLASLFGGWKAFAFRGKNGEQIPVESRSSAHGTEIVEGAAGQLRR